MARHFSPATALPRTPLIAVVAGLLQHLHRLRRRRRLPSDPVTCLPACSSSHVAWPSTALQPLPGHIRVPLPHIADSIADHLHRTLAVIATSAGLDTQTAAVFAIDRSCPICLHHSASRWRSSGTSSHTRAR